MKNAKSCEKLEKWLVFQLSRSDKDLENVVFKLLKDPTVKVVKMMKKCENRENQYVFAQNVDEVYARSRAHFVV